MMNKSWIGFLLGLFPVLVFAQNDTLSFAPPPGDYSIIFLGNIFGIVGGILHGAGSQMMGTIFSVFNAAVLALGGIIIMYTLIVATMKTAHEGQVMGQKWDSMWVPIRSTLGLALLVPKASGYCLMQVFVMWIVIQGVGAADKVWDAALGYLNRGGAIIQAQTINPAAALLNSAAAGIAKGAESILIGQVCMYGLQKQLEKIRLVYLYESKKGAGPCTEGGSATMTNFCNSSVPDFIGSVNIVGAQSNNPNAPSFSVLMPNFDSNSLFYPLNGICGTISWSAFSDTSLQMVQNSLPTVSSKEMQTAAMSRAIAIQQMFMDLSLVAEAMVNNDPNIGGTAASVMDPNQTVVLNTTNNYASFAEQQFGIPQSALGQPCSVQGSDCTSWGPADENAGPALFNGTELQSAISDYNAVMLPTLTLVQEGLNAQSTAQSREFLAQAATQGWIMAGSYFFNLANLNAQAQQYGVGASGTPVQDSNTGLEKSTADITQLSSAFSQNATTPCVGPYNILCTWFNGEDDYVNDIIGLVSGAGTVVGKQVVPNVDSLNSLKVMGSQASSIVYGYINNALILQVPGQPGITPLAFANTINIQIDPGNYSLPAESAPCGKVTITVFSFCLGEMLFDLIYNDIIRFIYNGFLAIFSVFINEVIMGFLTLPLTGMALIFKQGLGILSQPNVNPVVALANMGTFYINFAGDLWINLLTISIAAGMIPGFGIVILAIIAMAMPIFVTWVGLMVGIGFLTAYYIPLLPYMIFTFGGIAWLMAVIEAMVAAPIVALGVTHPEGNEAFGKGEQAIMILLNVFLRPSMMIIGYITGISLSYVGIWLLNAGFDNAVAFVQGGVQYGTMGNMGGGSAYISAQAKSWTQTSTPPATSSVTGGYTSWAGIFAYFFSILIYTWMYWTIVEKAFTMITYLPDKILRWIANQQESLGTEAAGWTEQGKQKLKEAGDASGPAMGQVGRVIEAKSYKGFEKAKKMLSGSEGTSVGGGGGEG